MLFAMNGDVWNAIRVRWDDSRLIDRTGELRLATTDPSTMTVCYSEVLAGATLAKVLIHEMSHCAMVSYGLLPELHRMTKPQYYIEMEEWVCNFLADYGMRVYESARPVIGSAAIGLVPEALGKVAA